MRYELDNILVRVLKNGYVVHATYRATEENEQGYRPLMDEEFITMNVEGIKGYIDSILRDRVRDA